jgi:hypothetical protein
MTGQNQKIADTLSKMTKRTTKWLSHVGSWVRGVASTHAGSIGLGHVESVGLVWVHMGSIPGGCA